MEVYRLCYVAAEISKNFIDSYKEDIIRDIPKMLEMNEQKKIINVFPRETGCDLDERFKESISDYNEEKYSFNDVLESAKRQLGVDYVVRIHTDTNKIEVLVVKGTKERAENFIRCLQSFFDWKNIHIVESLA